MIHTILEATYVLNEITFAKYVGCFQDTVDQDSAHIQLCCKEMSTFKLFDFFHCVVCV